MKPARRRRDREEVRKEAERNFVSNDEDCPFDEPHESETDPTPPIEEWKDIYL